MRSFTAYCAILSMIGIVMNLLFILVTRIQRVERVQEVLIFMRSISVGYIFVALALMAVAPQSITLASTNIRIPHGLLALSNAGLTSNFMAIYLIQLIFSQNGLAAFGAGCFLFTAFCFCLLFLYHYRKTAGQMSTVFAPKNVPVFLGVAIVFCLVQSFLLFYSKVDPNYLLERLSRSKKWDELQLSMGINPNSSQEGTSLIQQASNNNNANNGGTGGSSNAVSGGFQAITGGSNYSALAAAIESRQYDTRGSVSGGTEQTVRLFEGSFGTDYSRNPLYFLANGVLILTLVIAWIITIITATTVKCKLSGQQENMSDKSQIEMAAFTNVEIYSSE
uniref:7TM_GPCR_Srx domain-containing protein n=1 Tax=Meloidogyne hapla TaxID=6305 RepID=A0A1I8B2B5_MELHA